MKNLNFTEIYNMKDITEYRFYIKAIKPNYQHTKLLVRSIYSNKEVCVIYLAKPERLIHEHLRINNYDFETSTLFYNLGNLGIKVFIIVDDFGNPIYEFKTLRW